MKTKIKNYSSLYGMVTYFLPVLIVVVIGYVLISKISSIHILDLLIYLGIGVIAFIVQGKLTKSVKSKIEKMLFSDFEDHMKAKISKGDWLHLLPTYQMISDWITEYREILAKPSLAFDMWMDNEDDSNNNQLKVSLKNVYVSCLVISLYDLYYINSIDTQNAEFGNHTTPQNTLKTRALLQFMPVQDLIVYLAIPMRLNNDALFYLMKRDEKIGNFNDVCLALMNADCEVIAPMDVIDYLIARTKVEVPIKFSQTFMAYLIKTEVENRFNLAWSREKRKKVFDWYIGQEVKDLTFFEYWPSLLAEEIQKIKEYLSVKQASKIFQLKEVWSELSDVKMSGLFQRYIENPEKFTDRDGFLSEIKSRFI